MTTSGVLVTTAIIVVLGFGVKMTLDGDSTSPTHQYARNSSQATGHDWIKMSDIEKSNLVIDILQIPAKDTEVLTKELVKTLNGSYTRVDKNIKVSLLLSGAKSYTEGYRSALTQTVNYNGGN